ncbi:tetratricopeptide repeat protein [Ekhidna sp.]|uniref:tetratricopeptide repeat protein n=1 Tax=Ekhidna sp. TaxID=2608089 RepID=UPI003C7E85E3
MRKNLLIIIGMLCASVVFANGPFEKAMGKNIPAMFTAETPEELQNVINQLNRIGEAEGDRWEPYYYAAFGYIRLSDMYEGGEAKDKYMDLALETIAKADLIKPEDSELEALRGYVHMMRIVVDPATRGMKYSGMAFASFQKAVALNPENPRAHYLLGRMQFGTAQFMGNGDGGACETLARAKELFASEQPESPIAPSWGDQTNEEAIAYICKKEEGE